jgi:hypothetical protein
MDGWVFLVSSISLASRTVFVVVPSDLDGRRLSPLRDLRDGMGWDE